MELRFILIAATLHAVVAQYCPPNTVQAACSSVLVIYWNSNGFSYYGTSLRDALRAMGNFTLVHDFNAGIGTPDASLLASYDAVIIFGAEGLLDPDGLGDRLAAYHDQGGGVVVAGLANRDAFCVHGAWRDPRNGYALLDYASSTWNNYPDSLGKILEPESPLLTGVSSLRQNRCVLGRQNRCVLGRQNRCVLGHQRRGRGGGVEQRVAARGARHAREPDAGGDHLLCRILDFWLGVGRGWRGHDSQRAQVLAVHRLSA
jgi:hypothetical protein